MDLKQALQLRKKLLYLEGLIAWNTREYIWKVIIGPADQRHLNHFRVLMDPTAPTNPQAILQSFLQSFPQEELSVYFLLKTKGDLVCREYQEFLSANDPEPTKNACFSGASLQIP